MRRRDTRRLTDRTLPWFSSLRELDRARPYGFGLDPRVSRAAADAAVRDRVAALLPGAVDEGSAAVLDPGIAARTQGRLTEIDTEHLDHLPVIDRLVGMARERVATADAAHDAALHRLAVATADLAAARARLGLPAVHPVATPTTEENP
ncbi:hypothetical protein [Pseudonocardia alni]|uniref:hypothetical protein n=1 Tax=Pseudonocardia alni TaxID=33907 RepID=UPI0033E09B8A